MRATPCEPSDNTNVCPDHSLQFKSDHAECKRCGASIPYSDTLKKLKLRPRQVFALDGGASHTSIYNLNLDTRARNVLEANGILDTSRLIEEPKWDGWQNCGRKTILGIAEALLERGMRPAWCLAIHRITDFEVEPESLLQRMGCREITEEYKESELWMLVRAMQGLRGVECGLSASNGNPKTITLWRIPPAPLPDPAASISKAE